MNTALLVQRIKHSISTSMQSLGPYISTLALCISVLAFIVSSLPYRAVTRHYRLSVKPHVNVIFYLEGGPNQRNGVYITNPGLGPAIIKAVSVEVGGKSYDAVNNNPWRNVLHDLAIMPTCFRYGLVQPESALKPGEEFALLNITHANPPVVDGRSCHIQLLRLLNTEGLKVRIQYESMYGEPHERIVESLINSDMISDIVTVAMQQLAPKLAEQLQSMVAQLAEQMQQFQANMTKRTAEMAGQMLLSELYEDPPGAPEGWWVWRKVRFRIQQDFGHRWPPPTRPTPSPDSTKPR